MSRGSTSGGRTPKNRVRVSRLDVILVRKSDLSWASASARRRVERRQYRFVPPAARSRLADLSRARRFDLVLSGHVRQHRQLHRDGTTQLCPHDMAVLPQAVQSVIGLKRCGLLDLELTPASQVGTHSSSQTNYAS